MKLSKRGLVAFVLTDVILIAVAISVIRSRQFLAPTKELNEFSKGTMHISSPAFGDNAKIPLAHACDGRNVSPPLVIQGVPEGARSLALIMDDPDAPYGTWTHWTVWDILPSTTRIDEASAPKGAIQGKTSFGTSGYGGPCPPFGTHRYLFKLYALDTRLALPETADAAALEKAMEGHVLDRAGLVGLYAKRL